jgi:hypothetical protein
MPSNSFQLIAACLALVLLTTAVGALMLFTRVQEMRRKRIHPQAASTSVKMASKLENIQPADNFRNLFEVPVLFYALASFALATGNVPSWLAIGAWLYVLLRVLHSIIHCTYNRVYHRLAVFIASFGLLVAMWVSFFISLATKSAA